VSERIVVAMSGGVDSSVAAALLAERGDEVIGVTLHLAGSDSRCCSLEDADDARRVAERLGVRFYVANYKERFHDEVTLAFADAYLAGRTPIPCVTCNKSFKFDYLLERARVFGAPRVASGHYARIDTDPSSGRHRLRLRPPCSPTRARRLWYRSTPLPHDPRPHARRQTGAIDSPQDNLGQTAHETRSTTVR